MKLTKREQELAIKMCNEMGFFPETRIDKLTWEQYGRIVRLWKMAS